MGPYSMFRRCLYGKDANEYIFEYGSKFLQAYKDQPVVLNLDFIDQHEPSGEIIKYVDKNLRDFLELTKD